MKTFKELGLSNPILEALSDLKFETPTDIQEQTIPQLINGNRDFIGLAQTGTGKTAAFGLPLLELVDPKEKYTQALILAPTRELGKQIAEQLSLFSKYQKKINVLAVYGGAYIGNQIKALRDTQHVIIATPGRLIDLINRKAVKLGNLKVIVLDEADEMLNMGFKEDLDTILGFTPEDKLTWLFSATMPDFIRKIVKKYMDNPGEVKVNTKNEVNVNIKHQFTTLKQRDKTEALMRFLDVDDNIRGIVFCRTKRDTQDLAETLLQKGYKVDAIHGDLSQHQRDRVMKRFKSHDLEILVATDVAARGIDVNDLTHVFHYTLPEDAAYYTHRSGRTARAGKKGISLSFVTSKDNFRIRRMENQLKIKFEKVNVPHANEIINSRVNNWSINVLEQKRNPKIDKDLLEIANNNLFNLSKEELIEKLLAKELEKFDFHSGHNLNSDIEKGHGGASRSSRRGRDDKKRRGRYQGKRRSDDNSRSSSDKPKRNKYKRRKR